jgi:hypothetical protein
MRATSGAPLLRRTQLSLLRRLFEANFRHIVAEEGFTTTDGAIGVLATGTLDAAALRSLLQRVPEGTWELVTHPGYCDDDLDAVKTRLKGSRATERTALLELKEYPAIERISFAALGGLGAAK